MITFDFKMEIKPETLVAWGPENCANFFHAFGEMLRVKCLCDTVAAENYLKQKIADSEKLYALLDKVFAVHKEMPIDKELAAVCDDPHLVDDSLKRKLSGSDLEGGTPTPRSET